MITRAFELQWKLDKSIYFPNKGPSYFSLIEPRIPCFKTRKDFCQHKFKRQSTNICTVNLFPFLLVLLICHTYTTSGALFNNKVKTLFRIQQVFFIKENHKFVMEEKNQGFKSIHCLLFSLLFVHWTNTSRAPCCRGHGPTPGLQGWKMHTWLSGVHIWEGLQPSERATACQLSQERADQQQKFLKSKACRSLNNAIRLLWG